jgi:CRP-like cAMP-binding protein
MRLRTHQLKAGDCLIRANDQQHRVYIVSKGWLRNSTTLSEGLQPISDIRLRADIIGLPCLDQPNLMEDVISLTASKLISLSKKDFKDWMYRDPVLQSYVMGEIVRDLMRLQMMSAVIGHMKAPDRLAYFLFLTLSRSRRVKHDWTNMISIPMTQEDIGRMLGLTNVSVNRAFRALEADGLILTDRQVVTFLDETRMAAKFGLDERTALMEQLTGVKLIPAERP